MSLITIDMKPTLNLRETKNLTKIRFYSLTNIYIFDNSVLNGVLFADVPSIEMIRLQKSYSYFCFAILQGAKIVKHLHKLANLLYKSWKVAVQYCPDDLLKLISCTAGVISGPTRVLFIT